MSWRSATRRRRGREAAGGGREGAARPERRRMRRRRPSRREPRRPSRDASISRSHRATSITFVEVGRRRSSPRPVRPAATRRRRCRPGRTSPALPSCRRRTSRRRSSPACRGRSWPSRRRTTSARMFDSLPSSAVDSCPCRGRRRSGVTRFHLSGALSPWPLTRSKRDGLAVARDLEVRRVEGAELEDVLAPVVVGALLQVVEQRALDRDDRRLRRVARVDRVVGRLAAEQQRRVGAAEVRG